MNPPEYEYTRIEELSKRWDLSTKDLLEHCRQKNLKILIHWEYLKTVNNNISCIYTEEWRPVEIFYKFPILLPQSPCKNCHHINDESVCKFDYSEEFLRDSSEDEQASLNQIVLKKNDLWVRLDESKRFNSENIMKEIPPYLDPNHEHYREELQIAVDTWKAVYLDDLWKKDPGKTVKQNIEAYLLVQYPVLKEQTKIERILTMISPRGCQKIKNLPGKVIATE